MRAWRESLSSASEHSVNLNEQQEEVRVTNCWSRVTFDHSLETQTAQLIPDQLPHHPWALLCIESLATASVILLRALLVNGVKLIHANYIIASYLFLKNISACISETLIFAQTLSLHVSLSCSAGRWCRWEAGRWGWGWSWRTAPAGSSWPAGSPRSEMLGEWPIWSCAERAPWRPVTVWSARLGGEGVQVRLLGPVVVEMGGMGRCWSEDELGSGGSRFIFFSSGEIKKERLLNAHEKWDFRMTPGPRPLMWPFHISTTECDDKTAAQEAPAEAWWCVKLECSLSGSNTNVMTTVLGHLCKEGGGKKRSFSWLYNMFCPPSVITSQSAGGRRL